MTAPAGAVEFLKKVDIFGELDGTELGKLAAAVTERAYEKGAKVFQKGDPGGSVYVIRAGIIHITRDQAKGTPVVLARLSQGEIFGEMSYVDRRARSANALAAARTTLIVGERETLDNLFAGDLVIANKVLRGLARKMSNRLSRVDDQLEGFQDLVRHF